MTAVDAARHLTGVRLLVLEILSAGGSLTRDGILTAWEERRPDLSPAHRARLPWMRDETLWRLVNLGWVAGEEEMIRLTGDGEHVLRAALGR
ncbi:hypothetical protein [uncultured Microbacterium sp.]|uniref:hypothetical protein n=1 Tax=uncultured Microbacterium sp. TaxID=191216 RepID=UPI0025F711AF|nr:hypothetical protein [uncultured Microbacterium sp.]